MCSIEIHVIPFNLNQNFIEKKIISKLQTIQRLIKRDNLTEEQAKQRVESQPTNEEMVAESTVVFSTQWSYEFSQQQVNPIPHSPFVLLESHSKLMHHFLFSFPLFAGEESMDCSASAFDQIKIAIFERIELLNFCFLFLLIPICFTNLNVHRMGNEDEKQKRK